MLSFLQSDLDIVGFDLGMKKSMISRGMVAIHFLLMVAVFLACWLQFYRLPAKQGAYFVHNRTILVSYTLLLFTMSRIYGCYKVGLTRLGDLVYSQIIGNLVSWGITYVLACVMAQQLLNPLMGVAAFFLQCLITSAWMILMNRVYFRLHPAKKTVLIYRSDLDLNKLREVRFFEQKWNVVKRIQCADARNTHDIPDAQPDTADRSLYADELVPNDIHAVIRSIAEYDTVFVSGVNATLRNGIVKYCVEAHKDCFFVPHTGDVIIAGAAHIQSFSVPIFRARRASPTPEFLLVKRTFDVIISLIAVIVLSPLMAVTAIAIKAYDHGPALYKQVRLTKDGKEFKILKFRSMRVDAERDSVARLSTGENDDRITPIGRVIRAIRFDELPQLFNILSGDMSIVGPRPERPEIAKDYEKELPAFGLRLQVKAGLTGYAQVYGKYNTEPADKLKMDLMYINNIGIFEDLRLMLATIRILFMKESTEGVEAGQTTAMGQKEQEIAQKAVNYEEIEQETTHVG